MDAAHAGHVRSWQPSDRTAHTDGMDTSTIFTKTAKGAGAAAGKAKALTRDQRALLNEIDGRSSLAMLAQRLAIPEPRLQEWLAPLVAAGYIHAFVAAADELDAGLDPAQLPVLEDAMGAATIFAVAR